MIPAGHSDFNGIGQVCIARGGSTSCPPTPPLLNSTNALPVHQLRVAVAVNSSAGLTGFDIILLTDHTILKPAGIDLSGTVLRGTPVILAECLSGQLKVGPACSPRDTIDTIELGASSAVGAAPTSPPTTGLLFTAIYNVTATASSIPIGFQTGCSSTSVSGVCVTVTSPFGPNPETVQAAKFTDVQYFDIQGYNLNNPVGPIGLLTDPQRTTDTSLGLNVTSINGFNGKVTLTITLPPSLLNVSATVLPTIAWVNDTVASSVFSPTPNSVTLRVGINAPPGTYLLNFTGTSGSLPPNVLSITLSIPTPDFSISATPNPETFNVTKVGIVTVTLSGLGNFTGTVSLSLTHPNGLNVSLTNTQLTIPPRGGSVTTTLKANTTLTDTYAVNVTATAGTITHTTTIALVALDFTMTAIYPIGTNVLTIPQGQSKNETILLTTVIPYNVLVRLGKPTVISINSNPPSSGLSLGTCFPTVLQINSTGNSVGTRMATCKVTGLLPGNYTVAVPASSDLVTHVVSFSVQVLGPDFAVVPATNILTIPVGNSTSIKVSLVSKLSYTGKLTQIQAVFLLTNSCPSPPLAGFSFSVADLNQTNPTVNDSLTITTNSATQTGICSLVASATDSTTNTLRSAAITVVVTTTTSPHNLEVTSVTASPESIIVGSNVDITITVLNLGTVPEDSTIIALSGMLDVGEANFTNLAPGKNVTVTIVWKTSGFAAGPYTVGGQVLPVKGQTNTQNSIVRQATPVTLTEANTSVLQSPYIIPAIIAVLVALIAIIGFIFLQSRRKRPAQ